MEYKTHQYISFNLIETTSNFIKNYYISISCIPGHCIDDNAEWVLRNVVDLKLLTYILPLVSDRESSRVHLQSYHKSSSYLFIISNYYLHPFDTTNCVLCICCEPIPILYIYIYISKFSWMKWNHREYYFVRFWTPIIIPRDKDT